jgi:hypothetical protein
MSLLDRHAAVILNSDSETNQHSNTEHSDSETNQRGSSG